MRSSRFVSSSSLRPRTWHLVLLIGLAGLLAAGRSTAADKDKGERAFAPMSVPQGMVVSAQPAPLVSSAVVNFSELARLEALGLVPKITPRPLVRDEEDNEMDFEPGANLRGRLSPESMITPPPFFPNVASPSPTLTFQGLDDIAMVDSMYIVVPPDVGGAVGPTRVMDGHNNNYRIFDKATGAVLSTVGTATFWAPVVAASERASLTDPRTLYDPYNNRWIVCMQTTTGGGAGGGKLLIGVSQTSDPVGSWFLYNFNSGATVDFPNLGFNKNWISMNINQYNNAGTTFLNGLNLAVNYPSARTGTGTATLFSLAGSTGFCSAPCVTYSSTTDTLWIVTHLGSAGATYQVDRITGTAASPTYTANVSGTLTRTGGGWVQPSGNQQPQSNPNSGTSVCSPACRIESQDAQIRSAPVYRPATADNAYIYYAQTVGLPSGAMTHTGAQWTKIKVGGATLGAFVDGGRIEDPTATSTNGGKWYDNTHIAVNSLGDFMVGYTQFASNQHPAAGYSYHDHSDAAGTIRDALIYKAGEDYYHKTFSTATGRNRWGDFSTCQVDPSDDQSLWTLQEYAKTRTGTDDGNTGSNSSRWSNYWAKLTLYTITASAGANGTISPSGTSTVVSGGSLTYTITPSSCFVSNVLVDGVSQGAITSYAFSNLTANHTISATFTPAGSFTITASAGTGGTISPSGSVSVNCGSNQTFTITPDACHTIASVLVDGVSQGAISSYTFTNVQANHTISASFNLKTFTITASAGSGGTISPSGSVSVSCGANQSFTISPDGCHSIQDVLVDGVSQGAISSYTFNNVTANHTISVTFTSSTTFTITASAGSGGTISPSGSVSVNCGASQSFTISPDSCHAITDVLVDGVSQGAISSYTFSNVNANHTISATFAISNTFNITASAGSGGTISPSGSVSVNCGASQSFTISPDACHTVADVLVDGISQGAISSYTFDNVGANHTISASFNAVTYTITASAGSGGTISPSGSVSVNCGASQSFTISPDSCHSIAGVVVDGVSQGAISSYTFNNVTTDHTISATFVAGTYTLTIAVTGCGTIAKSPDLPNYPCGTSVTITATPCGGSHFQAWGGDVSGSTNPLTVTMGSNKTVTATFLQNVYSWNQTGTAAWTTSTNWTPARTTPASDDVLQFSNGATTTATGVPTQTIGQLVISGSTNVALQPSAAATLTIAGGSGTDLDVQAGSTLNLNGTSALTMALGSGVTGTVGGTINVIKAAHRLTATGTNSLVFQGGSVINVGSTLAGSTGYAGNVFGTTNLNSVAFQSGSIYAQSEGANPFAAGQPSSVVTFQTGSRFRLDGPITPSFSGRTYADFEANTAGATTTTGASTLAIDSFIVTQGTMNCNMTGGFNLRGNITVNPGATLNLTPASGTPSVTLNGSSTQTIAANGTLTTSSNETIEIANPAGVSLATDVTLGGSLKFTNGKVTTGAKVLALSASTGTVTGASQSAGWVNGNLRLNLSGASVSRTFDVGDGSSYTPVSVALHGLGAAFNLLASTTAGDHPNLSGSSIDATKSVNRYWTLTASGSPSFTSYDATFGFNAADVDGGANTANFGVDRYNGSTWSRTTNGTQTASSTQGTGITSFSDFAVGERLSHIITATAGSGGSIAPSGGVSVADSGSQAFTIAPDACHTIADVLVDGSSVGAVTNYTFTSVIANHTITASFSLTDYTITATAGSDGSITPSGATGVGCGSDQKYDITPGPGYDVDQLLVDGSPVTPTLSYTFTDVHAGHTISVTFKLGTTSVNEAPMEFALGRVAPNPTRGVMLVRFGVPKQSLVRVSVIDLQGREVAVLAQGSYPPGWYQASWGGRNDRGRAPAGMYFVRMVAGGRKFLQRVALTN